MTGYDAIPHDRLRRHTALMAAAGRRVCQALLTAPRLMSVGLAHGSGVILSTPA
jgi:hypothetical protein